MRVHEVSDREATSMRKEGEREAAACGSACSSKDGTSRGYVSHSRFPILCDPCALHK